MSEKMTTSEPTTGEIVRAFRGAGVYGITTALELKIIDRLESQEREIERLKTAMTVAKNIIANRTDELLSKTEQLTARAEQAERERDAAKADMKLIADAVREKHCDDTCCFVCKFDCDTSKNDSGEFENECPGFDRDDCFEWRGLPQDGEGL